jgi:hypothetical protein
VHGIFFYIGLGVGLAVASGLRPFLPLLLAGLLARGKALGLTFATGEFHFLQAWWWLITVAVLFALSYALQIQLGLSPTLDEPPSRSAIGTTGARHPAPARQPFAAALAGMACGAGAVLFAGTLAAHRDASWPGIIGGVFAAALAAGAVGPLIARARRRLPDKASRDALTLYLDGTALLVAALVCAVYPLGYVALILFALLWFRGRARGGERYAGLRILGR